MFPVHTPDGNGGCSCRTAECVEKEGQGKHPRTKHGFKDASADGDVVLKWWQQSPDANIGMPTGRVTGRLVLDVDPRHGGNESLEELERRCRPLPATWSVRTGGGGRHFHFELPEGIAVPCGSIAAGLDIKADGGYIIMPPSLHKSGNRYELDKSAVPPVPCPDWLLKLALKPTVNGKANDGQPTGGTVPEGKRRIVLSSIVGTMIARSMSYEAVEAAALTDNETRFDPPYPIKDLRKLVRDLWQKEQKKKKQPNGDANPADAPLKRVLDIVTLSTVAARAAEFLWNPYLVLAAINMLEGDPSGAKSWIALSIAAELSQGRLLDGRTVDPRSTL